MDLTRWDNVLLTGKIVDILDIVQAHEPSLALNYFIFKAVGLKRRLSLRSDINGRFYW